MFVISNRREVWWPVVIDQPAADGTGRTEQVQIEVRYRLVSTSEAREIHEMPTEEAESELIKRVLDWRGVVDEAGNDVPFSSDSLRQLLDIPYAGAAVARGLFEASNGAPAKN